MDFKTKIWDCRVHDFIEAPQKVDNFKNALLAVYNKYDLSLGHEDVQGAFLIEDNSKHNQDWLLDSHISKSTKNC